MRLKKNRRNIDVINKRYKNNMIACIKLQYKLNPNFNLKEAIANFNTKITSLENDIKKYDFDKTNSN